MTSKTLQISDKIMRRLNQIAENCSSSVSVGFMEGSLYPDGTPVSAVAFFNEFGTSTIPPRPFFRGMVAKESGEWETKLAGALKHTNFDGDKSLALMGEDIGGALIQSINEFTTPKLAESTAKAKGFDKPLIDTSHMINSIYYKVDGFERVKVE